jgi:hypothetical protein
MGTNGNEAFVKARVHPRLKSTTGDRGQREKDDLTVFHAACGKGNCVFACRVGIVWNTLLSRPADFKLRSGTAFG